MRIVMALAGLLVGCAEPAAHMRFNDLPAITLVRASAKSATPGAVCFRGYFYDGTADERFKFFDALQNVCDIFVDPSFRERVAARRVWFERSEAELGSRQMKDESQRVAGTIGELSFQTFHALVYDSGGSTTGSTEPCRGNLSLDRKRLETWGKAATRYQLIDTVAHEAMHLVASRTPCGASSTTTGPYVSRFQDGTRSKEGVDCFVSYQVGSLAACHYLLGSKASNADFERCLHQVREPNHDGLDSSSMQYCDPDMR